MPSSPPLQRLRWKSRRGWLELDLLLAAFWQRYGDTLGCDECALLAQWLTLDDDRLWALLNNPPADDGGASAALAEKIRNATISPHSDDTTER